MLVLKKKNLRCCGKSQVIEFHTIKHDWTWIFAGCFSALLGAIWMPSGQALCCSCSIGMLCKFRYASHFQIWIIPLSSRLGPLWCMKYCCWSNHLETWIAISQICSAFADFFWCRKVTLCLKLLQPPFKSRLETTDLCGSSSVLVDRVYTSDFNPCGSISHPGFIDFLGAQSLFADLAWLFESNQINHHNSIHQRNDTSCAISMYVSDFSCSLKSSVVIGSMNALMRFFHHRADSSTLYFFFNLLTVLHHGDIGGLQVESLRLDRCEASTWCPGY